MAGRGRRKRVFCRIIIIFLHVKVTFYFYIGYNKCFIYSAYIFGFYHFSCQVLHIPTQGVTSLQEAQGGYLKITPAAYIFFGGFLLCSSLLALSHAGPYSSPSKKQSTVDPSLFREHLTGGEKDDLLHF